MSEPRKMTLHRGAVPATEGEIASVPTPEATASYCPVPHIELVNRVKDILPRFDLAETSHEYALSADHQRMFGVIHTQLQDPECPGISLSIGMRNAHDGSFKALLLGGKKVWICDNLSYSAEIVMGRKHTKNIYDDLDFLCFQMVKRCVTEFPLSNRVVNGMMQSHLRPSDADHLLMESVRAGALPFTKLPHVDTLYREGSDEELARGGTFNEAFPDRTAWRLFNAFTHVYKGRHLAQQQKESQRLFRIFARHVGMENVVAAPVEDEPIDVA